jgi:hypothetical protein
MSTISKLRLRLSIYLFLNQQIGLPATLLLLLLLMMMVLLLEEEEEEEVPTKHFSQKKRRSLALVTSLLSIEGGRACN